MRTHSAIVKELERIDEQRGAQLRALAAQIRREHVIPACRRHRLRFVAGNGTYAFFRLSDDSLVDDRNCPRFMESTFSLLDINAGNSSIGAWIDDVTEADISGPRRR